MKKALGWIGMMVFAAAMISPAVAAERNNGNNDLARRGTQTVYSTGAGYASNYPGQTANAYGWTDRDDDRRGWDRDDDRGHYHVQYRRDHDRDFDDFRR